LAFGSILGAVLIDGFVHEAFVYDDEDDFVRGTAEFIGEGVQADEAVVVASTDETLDLLHAAVGDQDASVEWIDVTDTGRNPARMIPLWRDLVTAQKGRPVRAVGKLAPTRSAAECEEGVLNEALLNLAFEHAPGFRLRCPYDVRSTPTDLLGALNRTHPVLLNGKARESDAFAPAEVAIDTLHAIPPPAPASVARWPVALPELAGLRGRVHALATGHGLSDDQADDTALAVHEICKNSVRFGGGGTLAGWTDGDDLIFEVADSGRITELLLGRSLPMPTSEGGRGLWLANQLCDLVQIRSTETGTVVRLHIRR
jgi:anti-sigma regulatory factor (Ser/Thr protein kinase)